VVILRGLVRRLQERNVKLSQENEYLTMMQTLKTGYTSSMLPKVSSVLLNCFPSTSDPLTKQMIEDTISQITLCYKVNDSAGK